MAKEEVTGRMLGSPEAALTRARVTTANLSRACAELRGLLTQEAGRASPDEADALLETIAGHAVSLEHAISVLSGHVGDSVEDQLLETRERELRRLRKKLEESVRYRARLNQGLAQRQRAIDAAQAELTLVRGSYAFRVGSLIVGAIRSPGKLVRLPWEVVKLGREVWPRLRRRLAKPAIIDDGQPDLGPGLLLPADDAGKTGLARQDVQPVQRLLHGTATAPQLPADPAGLRIATVMDEFSFNAFGPCGDLRQLDARQWREEVETFQPHMLIVESAWKGKDESWARKVYPLSRELVELVGWCRERGIPTVFWNKEDPVHLSVFMRTARQFDFVFTTDIDCVRVYKSALGHDQVYWLPFACQPSEHHPIEEYRRKDAFCFAGSFYAKYPERQRDFATIVQSVGSLRPVEIYDRNAGGDDPGLKFPEHYHSMIQGALPYDQISLAYKGYRYGININTVKQSQSMFARRAFELLACNTVTVSNFSRGLRMLLGDLVVSSDDGQQLLRRIGPLVEDEAAYRKLRLAGLRKVMSEHTYQDRLRYVLEKVGGKPLDDGRPQVVVCARAPGLREARQAVASFQSQDYPRKTLALVLPDGMDFVPDVAGVELFTSTQAAEIRIGARWPECWFAWFCLDDHHGRNYLTDLVLATRYSDAEAVGKAAHFVQAGGNASLRDMDQAYRADQEIPWRRSLARATALPSHDLLSLLDRAPTLVLDQVVSIDEFNYCADGAGMDAREVDDMCGLWTGLATERLHRLAETATAADMLAMERSSSPVIDAAGLARVLPLGRHGDDRVSLAVSGEELVLESSLGADRHAYLYSAKPMPVEQLFSGPVGKFNLVVETEALVSFVLIFLDADRKRIGHAIRACSSNLSLSAPAGTHSVRLGLRVQGAGKAHLRRLVLGHVPSPVAGVPAAGRHLVISRGYPAYDNLYSYAYVHRRIQGYADSDVRADVFRLIEDPLAFREFEGVDVVSGQLSDLELMVRSNPYRTLMVHSLDRALWATLAECASDRRILVWVHGAEIQPWYRRDFSFLDARDRERGIQRSDDRMSFWKEMFSSPPANVTFVFVSHHLLREAIRDIGIELDPSRYTVIHNHIDGDLFAYRAKPAEQRKRLLSIRPYSRPTYANDLTVKAILDLAREPFFPELEFLLVGDGRLFDETVEPLRHLSNVILEQRFLTQHEIAALHQEYGVFLAPSRIDSQGVSRDEAMASGLVPVTNRVSAIPEFVDGQCGILVDPEDWVGMANAIRTLQSDPALFLKLSEAAARRVRTQSGMAETIGRELSLMQNASRESDAPATSTGRPRPIAVYGDLDLNRIDGSAVWAASLTEVLALGDELDVDLFLKAPIRNTTVLGGLLGHPNVRLVQPTEGKVRLQPEEALEVILEHDASRNYQAVVLRGFDLAQAAAGKAALAGRSWIYLTDIPSSADDFTPSGRAAMESVAGAAGYVLCQTAQLREHLHSLVPTSRGKTRLLPPMIPLRGPVERQSRAPGAPLRLAYAGKFAPLWGIREMLSTVEELRRHGHAIELHVFGDKIHNPPDDPRFQDDVRKALEGNDGLVWHRGLSRREVMEHMADMDIGWAWRSPELEGDTLEMSTKVLEYLSCGVPPILMKNAINSELLGADYPLFAQHGEAAACLELVMSGRLDLETLSARLAALVGKFTFPVVRRTCIEPLLEPSRTDGATS